MTYFIWWTIIGVIVYQLTILRPMMRDRPNTLKWTDIFIALPFGVIPLTAVIICYVGHIVVIYYKRKNLKIKSK